MLDLLKYAELVAKQEKIIFDRIVFADWTKDTGIAVVTVRPEGGDGPFGITVNSVASVSLEPPLVLFCLARASRHYQIGRAHV